MFSKNNDEARVMNAKCNNIEIMVNGEADKAIEELFQSLLSGYQIGLETSSRGINFIVDCVYLIYCITNVIK